MVERNAPKDAIATDDFGMGNSQSDSVEDTLDIQIHHLRKCRIRMCIELLTPRRSCIRKQDIYMVGRLTDFRNKLLDIGHVGAVGRNRDGFGTGSFVGKSIEGFAGFSAGRGFAGGDVDFGASGLQEARRSELVEWSYKSRAMKNACPDAACRPRPREPPVTTTTFPSREKMDPKSLSSVCALAAILSMSMELLKNGKKIQ